MYVFFAPDSAVTTTLKVLLPVLRDFVPVPDTDALESAAVALIVILETLLPTSNVYDVSLFLTYLYPSSDIELKLLFLDFGSFTFTVILYVLVKGSLS